jgi:uncharacterized membrane protein
MATLSRTPAIGRFRDAGPWIALLFALAIPAFWPSYLHPEKVEGDLRVHVHGAAMLLWAMLLVAQPLLIRSGRSQLHRRLGALSYGLAPVIVASTLLLAQLRLRGSPSDEQIYFFYIQMALLALFTVSYALGIIHRRERGVHARYMVCTAITMIDPIVARILYNAWGVEPPAQQLITFWLTDAVLLFLAWHDRRANSRPQVFVRVLALFVVLQAAAFYLPQGAAWHSFARWYGNLPLP